MEIRSLDNVPFPTIIDSFLQAFEGYFVQFPTDHQYWRTRFHAANVDFGLSYGAFDGPALVAFIIQGFGSLDGVQNAYNSGTGVLTAYRGQGLVDRLYAAAIPELRKRGVGSCSLEVIEANAVARRVYERIGFKAVHRWKSFKGTLRIDAAHDVAPRLEPADLSTVPLGDDRWYSWDHRIEAIERSPVTTKLFALAPDPGEGHVVFGATAGRIARLGVRDENDPMQWCALLAALAELAPEVLLVNVHERRTALITSLLDAGLTNHIDQFEMRMAL